MADSYKSTDLNKFVEKDVMIDYVLHKYGSNSQVHDVIADDILHDLLKREQEKQQRVKYDKRKVTEMKILELLEQKIDKVRKHLNKEKQIMVINMGKEKMVMERGNKTKLLKVNQGLDQPKRKKAFDSKQRSSSAKGKKATIPSEIIYWYDDLSLDEQRIIYKGRPRSSSRNAAITKPDKPKSRSKHLAPTTPRTGSARTTLIVPTKMPPLVTNCVLGLVAVTT
uniref:Uncharacterized protein n=1 Tax=Tanacetum cinerariifolium TaxID=118510 RepID=A0A699GNT8_TANCI|nr:hypothetical protein [Tanacetum cinerariifolium]